MIERQKGAVVGPSAFASRGAHEPARSYLLLVQALAMDAALGRGISQQTFVRDWFAAIGAHAIGARRQAFACSLDVAHILDILVEHRVIRSKRGFDQRCIDPVGRNAFIAFAARALPDGTDLFEFAGEADVHQIGQVLDLLLRQRGHTASRCIGTIDGRARRPRRRAGHNRPVSKLSTGAASMLMWVNAPAIRHQSSSAWVPKIFRRAIWRSRGNTIPQRPPIPKESFQPAVTTVLRSEE